MKNKKENIFFRNRLAEFMAELRIRTHRGMGYIYEVKSAALMGISLKILFNIGILATVFVTLGSLIGFYILGYIDVKYLFWMQSEFRLSTSKYNPHLAKVSDIENGVKKIKEKQNV